MASKQSPQIRRARESDALGIHSAHMLSIQALCSKDHSPTEIAAWGGRPFDQARWESHIRDQFVWVIEVEDHIEGFAHLRVYEKDGKKLAHVNGLYLTPKVAQQGWGRKFFDLMVEKAREAKAKRLTLSSTLTAHDFYKKMGFRDAGFQTTVEIAGTPIRSIPMVMNEF